MPHTTVHLVSHLVNRLDVTTLLPDDLVGEVFSRMSTTEMLRAALWTSRRFRQILLLTTETLEFEMHVHHSTAEKQSCTWRLAATASHAGPWPALRDLHLLGACTDLLLGMVFGPHCGFSAVTELTLKGRIPQGEAFWLMLGRLPRLMILDLSKAERMGGHHRHISAAIVKYCPGLRYLELKNATPAAMKLIDELELEKLVLNDTFIGDDGWRPHHSAMSMGFDHCSGLHASNVSLICSMSNLEDLFFLNCYEITGAGLCCGTTLKSLTITECNGLKDEGLLAVPGSPHLTRLSLMCGPEFSNVLGRASCECIATFAASFPMLEHLFLEGPELFEERQLRLIERQCRALTHLFLRNRHDRDRFLALFPQLACVTPKMPCHCLPTTPPDAGREAPFLSLER